jgi:hypothetical protein
LGSPYDLLAPAGNKNLETRSKQGGGSIDIVYEVQRLGCWRQLEVDRFIPAPEISLMNQATTKIKKEVEK